MKHGAKIILVSLSIFVFTLSLAYEKQSVEKAYQFLSEKWYYYDINGNKVKVTALEWRSSGNNYQIIVNGSSLDPSAIYDKTGKNVVNPSIKSKAEIKEAVGDEKGVLKGITEAHNKYRRITGGGLPDLVWDEEIAAYSQLWANYLKSNNSCNMMHRTGSNKKRPYGENLAWASGQQLEPDDVVKMWYDEIKDYDYKTNSCRGVCGHYTQVVWKSSKKVGCAMATCSSDNSEIWVCNYSPPGNYIGQKPY